MSAMHRLDSWTGNAPARASRQSPPVVSPCPSTRCVARRGPRARRCDVVATASSLEAAPAPSPAAQGPKPGALKLPRGFLPSICWERWELLMLQKEQEQDEVGPPLPAPAPSQGPPPAPDQGMRNLPPVGLVGCSGSMSLADCHTAAVQAPADAEWDVPSVMAESGQEQRAASLYFSHWDSPSSHVPYLQDQALVSAFRQAIKGNAALLRGKTVLDLGCGPGHLAMMCVQAGAAHVYAVDASEGAAAMAKQVVLVNGMSDRVTVVHGDVEALQLREKVDVIVSDCLGPMLLGGGMLRALTIARRTLLKPGGLVLPDVAELFVAGMDDRDFLMATKQQWEQLAGFDMSAAMGQVVRSPRLDTLSRSSQLFTDSCSLVKLGLGDAEGSLTLRQAAAGFSAPFTLQAQREDRLCALMLWFDAGFTFGGQAAQPPVVFSTGPSRPATHQQQLLLNFPKSIRLAKGDTITGTISWEPSEDNHRKVLVEVEVDYKGVVASASYTLPSIMTGNLPA